MIMILGCFWLLALRFGQQQPDGQSEELWTGCSGASGQLTLLKS